MIRWPELSVLERVGRLAVCVAATAWAVGGCWSTTTTSSAGSFVSDLQIYGDELSVSTCTIDYEVTHNHDLLASSDPNIFEIITGTGNSTETNMSANDCSLDNQRLPPGIDPPPPPRHGVRQPPAPALELVLTGRAQAAAAYGDCVSVRRYAAKVKSIASDYYVATFVTDPQLAPCLGGAP